MFRFIVIASLVSSSPCFADCIEISSAVETSLSRIQRAASSDTLKRCQGHSQIAEQALARLKVWAYESDCVLAQDEASEAAELLSEAGDVRTVELCRIYAGGASSVGWDLEDAVRGCCPGLE